MAYAPLTAVLGPTNTGKTHLAIERMCGHSSGLIGFPLRLLAREVYDRVCAIKGPHQVALITGEERIVPPQARWFLSTVESMPIDRDFAFVGIDEAQLAADPERGHIFTDRLLWARGREETMILGSESLRPIVRALVPDADIITRPRFSTLSYAGAKKLSRLPPRSAIVAFSVEQVYAVAEMLRRFRGGAAVVMGGLSPRTRNAQVAMFQAGEVDYLVATDAIGMGLNMHVDHIAFAGLSKFDGQRQRRLTVAEMAQIAGRAGRHQRDGSFGTLGGEASAVELTPEEIRCIEDHHFPPLRHIYWRNADLDFRSVDRLIADLEQRPNQPEFKAAPEAIDLAVLKRLADSVDVRGAAAVERFWALCCLPDFQKLGNEHHSHHIAALWEHLRHGFLPQDFVARRIADLDNMQGDIDTLSGRVAAVRTWAYVTQRADWLAAPAEMAARAIAVEEKLSDALHARLAERFINRRTSVLMRKMDKDAGLLPVRHTDTGAIEVDGEAIGTLDGFRFTVDASARVADRKLLLAAAERHLGGILATQAAALVADPARFFALESGEKSGSGAALHWRGHMIGRISSGKTVLQPGFQPDRALLALPPHLRHSVAAAAEAQLARLIRLRLKPLLALQSASRDAAASPAFRAIALQLAESGGLLPRTSVTALLAALTARDRQHLRQAGVVVGSFDLFIADMLKSGPRRLFALLSGQLPPDSATAPVLNQTGAPFGYRRFANQSVRVDSAEKLVRAAHLDRGQARQFVANSTLATSLALLPASHAALLRAAGFRKIAAKDTAPDLWAWRGMKPAASRAKSVIPAPPRPDNGFAALRDLALRHG